MADSRMTERGAAISITLNGEGRKAPAGVTVAGLLSHLDMRGRQVAVARNSEIVPRSDFEAVRIEDGDRIEIVQAIGGAARVRGGQSKWDRHTSWAGRCSPPG